MSTYLFSSLQAGGRSLYFSPLPHFSTVPSFSTTLCFALKEACCTQKLHLFFHFMPSENQSKTDWFYHSFLLRRKKNLQQKINNKKRKYAFIDWSDRPWRRLPCRRALSRAIRSRGSAKQTYGCSGLPEFSSTVKETKFLILTSKITMYPKTLWLSTSGEMSFAVLTAIKWCCSFMSGFI